MNLKDRYEANCRTPSDIYQHLPRFVALVNELDAKHVIELGTRTGISTVAWLYALEFSGGHLTTVDLSPAPDVGMWTHWRHIQGNDRDPEVVERLEPADIVFIDTSHHYHDTVAELNLYRWLIKPGGVLCGHDSELIWPEGAAYGDGPYPVKRAVQEFVAVNGYDATFHTDCFGLFVLRGF